MRSVFRHGILTAALVAGSVLPSAAQDVLRIGREHDAPVPEWVRAALARDPGAFEVRNGWKPALSRAKAERAALAQRGRDPGSFSAAAAAAYGTAVTGKYEIPVLGVMFANTATEPYPAAELQARLFGTGTTPLTMTAFYTENSRGTVEVSGMVAGWAHAAYKDTYYEGGDNGAPPYIGELLRETVEQLDSLVDFSRYDFNQDGVVDAVAFVHAESGGECSTANIWSHRWTYTAASGGQRLFTKDGVEIVDYSIQPAFSCNGVTPIEIAVFAHETAHLWGLPDLYASDYSNRGIGEWDLMSFGTNNTADSPAHLSAWSKAELGWMPVFTIAHDSTALRLDAAETTGGAIRIDVPTSPGEYFLLENRQRIGSDQHLKGTGLLIWHVDSTVIARNLVSNSVQNDVARKGIDLVEADGANGLDSPSGYASASHTFPGSTFNYAFGNATNPRSTSNAGLATGIAVQNIAETAGVVTLDVKFEQPACAPATGVVGQTHAGSLAATDCVTDGRYYDAWVLNLAAATTVRMDLSSTVFDAYLILTDAKGNTIVADDDGAGVDRGDARIETTLDPGQYVIWATSYAAGESGAYTLSLSEPATTACTDAAVVMGQTSSGALAATDCLVSGRYYDHWSLAVTAETRVQLTVASDTFDTYLILQDNAATQLAVNDDYTSDGTNSQITYTLAPGNYHVWVTSYSVGETGAYTLEALDLTTSECVPGSLAIGAPASGVLRTLDCNIEGYYYDAWILDVAADAVVTLDLASNDYDTFLVLSDTAGNFIAEDDDGGAGTNSNLTRAFTPGRYVIWATSYAPGATGSYSLSATVPVACSVSTVAFGQTTGGTLSAGDCTDDGYLFDAWTLDIAADTAARVTLSSTEFDTYLIIADEAGNTVLADDDGGTGTNSMIVADLATGRYTVWVSSYAAGATGSYSLDVRGAADAACSTSAIELGQTGGGSLATTDCAANGYYMDGWVLELGDETEVELSLTSADFDAYMILVDAAGSTIEENDDAGDGTDSGITRTLAAGRYTVWVTSFEVGDTGAYELTAVDGSAGSCFASTLTLGQTVSGNLEATDCPSDGYYNEPWHLTLAAQTTVRLDLASSEFDAYLILTDSTGSTLASNDNFGSGTNARIERNLAAGAYYVWASSAYRGETGAFTLSAANVGSSGAPCYRRGDANADGKVDRLDAALMLEWIAQGRAPDAALIGRADANADGSFSLADARAVADLMAGKNPPGVGETLCETGGTGHE